MKIQIQTDLLWSNISQSKSKEDINKCLPVKNMFPMSICLFMFYQRKRLIQPAQKSECQQFWPVLSVLVFSVSPRLSHPLALCCALHFPDVSDGLRSEVSIYTVILYLLDEHICLLQGTHS